MKLGKVHVVLVTNIQIKGIKKVILEKIKLIKE